MGAQKGDKLTRLSEFNVALCLWDIDTRSGADKDVQTEEGSVMEHEFPLTRFDPQVLYSPASAE